MYDESKVKLPKLLHEDPDSQETNSLLKDFNKLTETIGDQLWKRREGLSVKEATKRFGITRSPMYRLESGKRNNISILDLLDLANKYKVSIEYLLNELPANTPAEIHEDYKYEVSRKHIHSLVKKYAKENKELCRNEDHKGIRYLLEYKFHISPYSYKKKQQGKNKRYFTLADAFIISRTFGINISDVIYPSTVLQNEIPVDF